MDAFRSLAEMKSAGYTLAPKTWQEAEKHLYAVVLYERRYPDADKEGRSMIDAGINEPELLYLNLVEKGDEGSDAIEPFELVEAEVLPTDDVFGSYPHEKMR